MVSNTLVDKNKIFKFPAGEIHFKSNNNYPEIINIERQHDQTLNDWLIVNLLASEVYKENKKIFGIFLPYLPYSRQDRKTSNIEPFSLKTIGRLINLMSANFVYTLDVHSDVASACVDNLINIPPEFIWSDLNFKDKTLIIPDQGAYKKLKYLSDKFKYKAITIKERNTSNGHVEIKDIVIPKDASSDYIIIDDICDGGATFIQLIQYLRDKLKVNSIELAVTHGIFSKGIDKLYDCGINKIYTTDSFNQTPNHNLEIKSSFKILQNWLKKEEI